MNITKETISQKLVLTQTDAVSVLPSGTLKAIMKVASDGPGAWKAVKLVTMWAVVNCPAGQVFAPAGLALVTTKTLQLGKGMHLVHGV